MAVFKTSGKVPVDKERLTIVNNSSERQLKTDLKNGVGMGSSGVRGF